jgi:putative hydrolase of the HAD superfamily
MSADLTHVETWLFDLDNTLYPAESEYMALIEGRMTDFVERETGLPREKARALQKKYYTEHGTTLAGLMAHHGMEPKAFLDEVHDVSMDRLIPDAALRTAIDRLPGRRLIFTNGSEGHAERVLAHLGLRDLFSDVFAIETADYVPKPVLDAGEARVAEKIGGEWVVHQWLKKAVLLSFRLTDNMIIANGPGEACSGTRSPPSSRAGARTASAPPASAPCRRPPRAAAPSSAPASC